MKTRVFVILIFLLAIGCQSEPRPISYGNENCNFCSMTIMDDKHAAEIITQKGRIYVYDSIECMIRSLDQFGGKVKSAVVMDYNNPGTFIDATTAAYLISPEIPSPMGANLSAFSSREQAANTGFSEVIYTWEEIQPQIILTAFKPTGHDKKMVNSRVSSNLDK